jgi:ubiquinone biosynthesis protein COQ4
MFIDKLGFQGNAAMTVAVIDTRLRPLTAFRAVRRLLSNPDDTAQVFVILRAMRGSSALRAFRRFCASPAGSQVMAEQRSLLEALDPARLAAMPDGSLGRTYRLFMQEENLSATGLMQAGASVDDGSWPAEAMLFRDRMRVMHDLTHVVTGYGRDPFGELCLLAFNNAQVRNWGLSMLVGMGTLRLLREKTRIPALAAVWEARRHGLKSGWLPEQDWESLLALPLEEVRRKLRIVPPNRYAALVEQMPKDRL